MIPLKMADRDSPNINVGILTISDSCYNGSATDRSGENLKHLVETGKLIKGTVVTKDIIPDELDQIKAKLLHWSDHLKLDLILTTGGTGFAHRDVTPEATKAVLEKEAMGLTVAMLKGSLDITPMAMLTRLVCGSRGSTLIINLPGSTKGSSECFQIASVAIPHAVDLLRGHKYQVERTHSALQAEHNLSQPSAGCEMLEKNLDYHLLDSVSSKVSSAMKTTETYLHSLDSFLHDTSGQTTLTQDSSVSTLMWKALLSLPKEAMLSLVNSFSSLTEASSSSSASTPNQDPYLHSSELKSQQAVVSSSLLPVVHKTQSLPEFLTSKGQRPVHLNHSSQMLPSNIQVVRPQITSVSPSQNSHVGSHHLLHLDNTFNSSRSNTIGVCPSNVASHPQDISPEHCHRSVGTQNAEISSSSFTSGNELLSCVNMPSQASVGNIERRLTSTNYQIVSNSLPMDNAFPAPCTSRLHVYESNVQALQSPSYGKHKAVFSCPLSQSSLHSKGERSDNILAREIKPPVQSSFNHVVQVFLPSSSYPETEQSGQRDGSWQTNNEFNLLRSKTEYQKMELSTNESPPSYLQNYSNLREDVNISVESLFNTNQTSETISNFESDVQKDHHSEHKSEASNVNATNTVRSTSSQQLKTCKNKSIESTLLIDSQLKSNKKIITEFRYCSPNNTPNSSWHKLKDPVSTSIKSAKIHYMKSKGELLYVPVGDSLRSFINEHPMVQGIYLHKGKREIKKQLAQLCRQYDSGDRMTSWRRGKEILERNRFDDFFELTEEGRKEQEEVLASRKRDQYVVNWYVWCPGHSNCRRKCGGFGMCLEKCKGMMHKQDRHNCSLMINMKLFLSDMSTWRVNIIGSHVPFGSGVNWVPPVLYSLQSSSGRMLDDLSSTEQAKTAQRNSSCKKTATQSSTSAGSDAANNLPPASLSLHKVCKSSTQTSKGSMTFPSKKRISKMLSNLKRRRLERQSSLKTASFRKGDNSVISNEQDNFQLEGLNPKIAWGTKDVGSEADRDHGTHSSMKHPVNSDFENIFENLTRHFGIDVSARKLSNYTTECEINKADTSAMPDSTGLVKSSLAVERSNNLKCSPILTHKYNLDVAQGLGLDQPYLNANTLSDILQQANGQDNFDFQGEMSSSIDSGLNDSYSSKSLNESKSEYRMNWHSSNAVKQDISFLSDVFPLQTSSACSPQSNNLFECSDAPLNTYIKSESEAIASIVQSLCGASDFDTMQAIALHDPMVNPELTDTTQHGHSHGHSQEKLHSSSGLPRSRHNSSGHQSSRMSPTALPHPPLLNDGDKGNNHHHHHHHRCHAHSHVNADQVALRSRESPYPIIPVKQAVSIVLESVSLLPVEPVEITCALGLYLAASVYAADPLPPFCASIKDGYAVKAEDGAGVRMVYGESSAGDVPEKTVTSGFCMRINTGAPVPNGADAVVQVEDTELVEASVDGKTEIQIRILKFPTVGQDIRPVGSDIEKGQEVLSVGQRLGPSELGLLATVGVTTVQCYSLPTVGVLSTGNELVEPHVPLTEGKIRDSNRTVLLAQLKELGVPSVDLGIARDSPDTLLQKLSDAMDMVDIVVTTGGVSMGDKDYLKQVLLVDLKAKIHFARVLMKPGSDTMCKHLVKLDMKSARKPDSLAFHFRVQESNRQKPTTFATLEHKGKTKIVFGLPGNPVSSIVTCHLYLVPAIRKMSGCPNPLGTVIKVKVDRDLILDPRPEYHRASLTWDADDATPTAHTTGNQISSRLLSMSCASVLMMLPASSPGASHIPKGALVDALVIGPV